MGIFNTQNPVEVLREYLSFSKDIMEAAEWRSYTSDIKKMMKSKKPVTEAQIQCFQNLSEEEADQITYKLHGHIYPEVLVKMLDVLPESTSKEILLEYGKHCELKDEVVVKALDVLGTDARELLLILDFLSIDVFNKMVRVFSKAGAKDLVIAMVKDNFHLADEVEMKILRIYSDEDLRDLLKTFVSKLPDFSEKTIVKLFDVCTSKEELKATLELAIKNDADLWNEALEKIVKYFPKDEAEPLLDAFFKTSPGCNEYSDKEIEELYAALY